MGEAIPNTEPRPPKIHISLPMALGLGATALSVGAVGAELIFKVQEPAVMPPPKSRPELPQAAPTERPGVVRGMIGTSDGVVDSFMSAIQAGSIKPESEGGIHRNYFHGFLITVNGVDFKLVGTNPAGEQSPEWWFQGQGPWESLHGVEKMGRNAEGLQVKVTALESPTGEDVLWFPATLTDFEAAINDPTNQDGIVFRPPKGSPAIPNYDAASGRGILIPLSKQADQDPLSAQNIFEGIAYRGGPNITPTEAPTPVPQTEQQVMEEAQNNFWLSLEEMKQSSNPLEAKLPEELTTLLNEKKVKLIISQPRLDGAGNIIIPDYTTLISGYNANGDFLIEINSGVFAQRLAPVDYIAADLETGIKFQEYMNEKIQAYLSKNPNMTIADALKNNPDFLQEASIDALFYATQDVLIPIESQMTKGDTRYSTLVALYNQAHGDINEWRKLLTKSELPVLSG